MFKVIGGILVKNEFICFVDLPVPSVVVIRSVSDGLSISSSTLKCGCELSKSRFTPTHAESYSTKVAIQISMDCC